MCHGQVGQKFLPFRIIPKALSAESYARNIKRAIKGIDTRSLQVNFDLWRRAKVEKMKTMDVSIIPEIAISSMPLKVPKYQNRNDPISPSVRIKIETKRVNPKVLLR